MFVVLLIIPFENGSILAQEIPVKYSTKNFLIEKAFVVHPLEIGEDWMPQLQNLEMPLPGSERGKLLKIKEKSKNERLSSLT